MNRKAMRLALLLCWLAAPATLLHGAPDIYFEDSHAGSFYWIVEHLSKDEPAGLVLIDAHSDATAQPNSEKFLHQFAQSEEPSRLLKSWRQRGAISCDAWIEPLMPAPIASVLWIPSLHQEAQVTSQQKEQVRRLLTAHAEVSARDTALIARRFEIAGLDQAERTIKTWPRTRKVVASIDLDFFAEIEEESLEDTFDSVWQQVLRLDERLAAITFAVSRPWLKSDRQASRLVELALRRSLTLQGARIELEPFASTGPDSSATFMEHYKHGEKPPVWKIEAAEEPLRSLLLSARSRLNVITDGSRWNDLLDSWDETFPVPRLSLTGRQPGADEVWRLEKGESFTLGFDDSTLLPANAEVRWFVLRPKVASYNLMKQLSIGKMFASQASSLPAFEPVEIEAKGAAALSEKALNPYFDPGTGCGVVRVFAEVRSSNRVRQTSPVAIARHLSGHGVRSMITEGFGLPYVFGITFMQDKEFSGPETLIGSDCANFVIAALRKTGHAIPWGAPADLRRALRPAPKDIHLTEAILDEGVIVDFDTHATLLMEDRGQAGVVDPADIVAHHLEGYPAMIPISDLMRQRQYKSFQLFQPNPKDTDTIRLILGGDVMLGRGVAEHLDGPLRGIQSTVGKADLAVVNLECVISPLGMASAGKTFLFRAPEQAATALARARIGAVSLANNHSMDFGATALLDMQSTLQKHGVRCFGAGRKPVDATVMEVKGLKIALMGLSSVSSATELASADRAGVADIEEGITTVQRARKSTDFVVAFVHWGTEGRSTTTAEQRALARRLVRAGADLIVGAHPHCIQPLDQFAGRPVAFSLGNLVFDGGLPGTSWTQGSLLEVEVGVHSHLVEQCRTIPVKLDKDGLPQEELDADTKKEGAVTRSLLGR